MILGNVGFIKPRAGLNLLSRCTSSSGPRTSGTVMNKLSTLGPRNKVPSTELKGKSVIGRVIVKGPWHAYN